MLRLSRGRRLLWPLIKRLPDGTLRRLLFMYFNRRLPHFAKPATFNDKVNWRIINDRRPLLEWTCDKLSMKDYVRGVSPVGLHIPRTIWYGSDIRELQEIALPGHWVLKPNNRSGLIYFGRDQPNVHELSTFTAAWLDRFDSSKLREWAYSTARYLLFVEELIGTPGIPPPDYKFFVFGGQVVAVQMDVNRHSGHQRRLYLPDWSPLEVKSGPHELADVTPPPLNLEQMVAIAAELGRPFDHMRVDLYDVNGVIEFGELTTYPGGGLDRFVPASFDCELARAWELPKL